MEPASRGGDAPLPDPSAAAAEAEVRAHDFTFRAPDDDGAMVRYDALLSFTAAPGKTCYLVYADAVPDDDGEVGTYASTVCDPGCLERAQAQVDGGCVPKKPPVFELRPVEDPWARELVGRVLDLVEAEEDD